MKLVSASRGVPDVITSVTRRSANSIGRRLAQMTERLLDLVSWTGRVATATGRCRPESLLDWLVKNPAKQALLLPADRRRSGLHQVQPWVDGGSHLRTDGGTTPGPEAYAENTPITWIMGDEQEVKIVVAMLSEFGATVTCTDIAELAGTDRTKACDHLDTLAKFGLVLRDPDGDDTETLGAHHYKLDESSDVVRHLMAAEEQLLDVWYHSMRDQSSS